MPLVFSSTVAIFITYLVKTILNLEIIPLPSIIMDFYSNVLNIVFVSIFSCIYSSLTLDPTNITEILRKTSCNIVGVSRRDTKKYLEKILTRLSFIGGSFLTLFTFYPLILDSILKVNIFKSVGPLLILIGVTTEITSKIQNYYIISKYEEFE